MRRRLASDAKSDTALWGIRFLTSLIFSTREPDPARRLRSGIGVALPDDPSPQDLIGGLKAKGSPSAVAAEQVILEVTQNAEEGLLFPVSGWAAWRAYDGPAFCDLARSYFSKFLNLLLAEEFRRAGVDADEEALRRFAHEASIITRAFSARWFNACARVSTPDLGSVRWYFGHCVGKLDLELERELSDWIEPDGNPWKRRRASAPQLEF